MGDRERVKERDRWSDFLFLTIYLHIYNTYLTFPLLFFPSFTSVSVLPRLISSDTLWYQSTSLAVWHLFGFVCFFTRVIAISSLNRTLWLETFLKWGYGYHRNIHYAHFSLFLSLVVSNKLTKRNFSTFLMDFVLFDALNKVSLKQTLCLRYFPVLEVFLDGTTKP